jgi:manganese/iron transport system ATP-binding protein
MQSEEILSIDLTTFQPETARLEVQAVSLAYNGVTVLDKLSFSVPHGERIAVVGPNGAGKSTLFKALAGLLPVKEGQILIHGRPLGNHQDCVAYIPQKEEVDWRFPVTVEDVVLMGRFGRVGWLRSPSKNDREVVRMCMSQMKILALAQRPIGELSGGQQQRVFLARALAQEPHILIMDEPFTGIDVTTQEILFNLLDGLREQKVSVMVSTHDLNMAAERFDRILLLKKKMIAYGTSKEVFVPNFIREAFGEQVLIMDGVAVVDHCCPGDEHEHVHED